MKDNEKVEKPLLPEDHADDVFRGFIGNPLPLALVLKAIGFAARIAKKAGAIEYLNKQAAETETKLDDLLISVLANLIDHLTAL